MIIAPAHVKVAPGGTLESLTVMDFTHVARTFAHIFFWYGILGVVFAFYQGFTAFEFPEGLQAQSKYLTREVGGAMTVAFMGLALGVLCEISLKRTTPDKQT